MPLSDRFFSFLCQKYNFSNRLRMLLILMIIIDMNDWLVIARAIARAILMAHLQFWIVRLSTIQTFSKFYKRKSKFVVDLNLRMNLNRSIKICLNEIMSKKVTPKELLLGSWRKSWLTKGKEQFFLIMQRNPISTMPVQC